MGTKLSIHCRATMSVALVRGADIAIQLIGAAVGAIAFYEAAHAVVIAATAAVFMTQAGGLGALAFGTIQVHRLLVDRQAGSQRATMSARAARRMLIDRINSARGGTLAAWVERVGDASSLNPIERELQRLTELAAPLRGRTARSAEGALREFFRGADQINGLHAGLPAVSDFKGTDITSKGRALSHWIRSVDLLGNIAAPHPEDISINGRMREYGALTEKQLGELSDRRNI
jgi:hypothetical protein